MRNSDRPVTRSLIIEHVWDIHFDSISNVVEVHINSLRNKIDRGFAAPLIHTIRGVGYMFVRTRSMTPLGTSDESDDSYAAVVVVFRDRAGLGRALGPSRNT